MFQVLHKNVTFMVELSSLPYIMKRVSWAFLFLFISFSVVQAQTADSSYSFFVAGHTYGSPGVDNDGLHPPFVDKFEYIQNRPEIAFGTFLGDIVFHSTEEAWDDVDGDIDSLGLPVYFAVGNHDMYNRPLFEERYGDTYYSFLYSNDLFIVLDPNIDQWNISGDQKLFLINTLDNNADSVEKIFVFFHQTLWWQADNKYSVVTPNSTEGRADTINFWSEIEPLFNELANEVVMFAGDVGAASYSEYVMYDKYDNITFVATGMGKGDGDNFVVINESEGDAVSYDLICLHGDLNCLGSLEDNDVDYMTTDTPETELIEVYPNPVNKYNEIRVKTGNAKNSPCNLTVYSGTGSLIYEHQYTVTSEKHITVPGLPSGIYLFSIEINGEFYTSTVMVVPN